LFDRLQLEALSCAYSRREVDDIERLHPELIVEKNGNIILPIDHGDAIVFAYSFASARAFSDKFEALFDRALPKARKAYPHATAVRFRLMLGSARPAVEPVLRRLWFTPGKAWFHFSLVKGTPSPKIPVARSVTFREGSLADLDDLLAIDREAFPDSPVTRDGMRRMIEDGGRVLLATQRDAAVGFALYGHDTPGVGYLRTLAVREASRGNGIGAALTLRVAKTLFAEGATQLDLRTDDDNASAIRLYTWLGFKHAASGRDYDRPADPRVIERMRKDSEGTFIKFGGWR
jgi:ribosomal protein S18 acetylase RimI-like enzyme